MSEAQIAVLIDFENVGLGSIQWLFDQISDVGRVIVKRAYADWSIAGDHRDQLLELGVEPIHLFHTARSRKNASDLRLAIDGVDLLYQSPVDTFVIVSTDSDFVALVNRLRAAGKTVFGAGRQATAPRTLVISCDRFFYLDQADKTRATIVPLEVQPAQNLLLRAVTASLDGQGRVVGSKLHQTLQRLDPSFDFRTSGHSTFTRYLEASPGVRVTRPRGRGDVNVELADSHSALPDDSSDPGDPGDPDAWGPRIDAAWGIRATNPGDSVPGTTAASFAAPILGVTKLSASQYKTLQSLFDASELLRTKWLRDGNRITKR